MRSLLINRSNLLFLLRLLWKPPIHPFTTRRSSVLFDPSKFDAHTFTDLARAAGQEYMVFTSADPRKSDRKSTRLNSSHRCSSYAVFCLKIKYSRCDYYGKHQSFQATSGFRDNEPND